MLSCTHQSLSEHFCTRSVFIDAVILFSPILHHYSILHLCRVCPSSLSVAGIINLSSMSMVELLLDYWVSWIALYLYLNFFNLDLLDMNGGINASSCLNCLPWVRLEHNYRCISLATSGKWCLQENWFLGFNKGLWYIVKLWFKQSCLSLLVMF